MKRFKIESKDCLVSVWSVISLIVELCFLVLSFTILDASCIKFEYLWVDLGRSFQGMQLLVFIGSPVKSFTSSQYSCCAFFYLSSISDFLCSVSFLVVMTQSHWMTKSGGKMVELPKPRLKISVPRFDNSELIAQYARTVIGRCMNPPKQAMKNLLFMFPRFWNVEGRVVGVDLGLGRFRFDFEREEDIVEVMKMEPFHFDHWMVSMVR